MQDKKKLSTDGQMPSENLPELSEEEQKLIDENTPNEEAPKPCLLYTSDAADE